MKDIYLYTNSKDRITNARLQTPVKIGDICRIYVDGQYKAIVKACKAPRPGYACYHCCISDIYRSIPDTCIIPIEYIKEADEYLGMVCCGDPGCYLKDMVDLMEDI